MAESSRPCEAKTRRVARAGRRRSAGSDPARRHPQAVAEPASAPPKPKKKSPARHAGAAIVPTPLPENVPAFGPPEMVPATHPSSDL